ncbi:hypothetical protein CCACVL1_17302 [Corchorus capsularis]|uniref:Uncharacterized protein n=1 Tax=Corchorus capsularis TaxID=210143 RepID=A0A1R3HSH4_COCAP|nr:hypothetical protein CCACVL1_17302 [Corchorus capsularis]
MAIGGEEERREEGEDSRILLNLLFHFSYLLERENKDLYRESGRGSRAVSNSRENVKAAD